MGSSEESAMTGGAAAVPVEPAPIFSVAIVCLNAGEHLAEALDSVLAQGALSYELVIVDGGSSDETLSIIGRYEPRFGGRMRAICEPDDGLYDAMNKALDLSVGEFIVFLGADDRLAPGALECVERVLTATSPHPRVVCGATCVFGSGDSWIERPERVMRRGMLQRAPSRHQSIYARLVDVRDAGGFNTRFGIAADYDLYLRLDAIGTSEVLVNEVLSDFRLGGASSRSALSTAREYRSVRVAHGANALIESVVMLKSALGVLVFATWRRLIHGSRQAAK